MQEAGSVASEGNVRHPPSQPLMNNFLCTLGSSASTGSTARDFSLAKLCGW